MTKTMATDRSDRPGGDAERAAAARPRLAVDVALLLRRPGDRSDVSVDLRFDDLLNSVVEATHVVGVLTVESMADSLSVTGHLAAPWRGECRRCLGDAEGVTEIEVAEVFERRPTDGETYPLEGDTVDLAPMAREQMLLSLPLAPLCDEACPGPDPERFPSIAPTDDEIAGDGSDDDPVPMGDPRWAALDALRFDDD